MRCEYDSDKATADLAKHRVSFADAEGVFQDPLAVTVEDPDAEGERRFDAVGLGSAGELPAVVYTERKDACRPTSARRATRTERKQYES